jgi:acetylornithine deacetylase/succinyl-diaminopimelate desuccinylase-like protein
MQTAWKEYLDQNGQRFLDEMLELLRIPSVSAKSEHKDDMRKCAELVKQRLLDSGADKAEVMETAGHPVVYAEKIIDPSKPTVLVYGHYDVQPAEPLELWHSGPFEPVIKDGKVYARGSADDKGQFYMHVKAMETMVKTNTLATNIKFLIEGEEEVGSPNLGAFVSANKELLKADVILISDSAMLSMENPSLDVGVRGLSYIEVEVTGANRDLHSGTYGGAAANPITMLAKMIAQLHDENNHVTIPGFYDDVVEATKEERELMSRAPFNEKEYKDELGVTSLRGEKGFTTNERTGIRPTIELNDWFQNNAPEGVTVRAWEHHGGEPYMTPIDSKGYQAAAKAIEQTFGKTPIPVRGGGSIPICSILERELGIKIVFMGFGLDNDNLHSPNEKYNIENYYKGIETIPYFHRYFAE